MNVLCRLAENDTIIRDITDKIQKMVMHKNYEIIPHTEEVKQIVTLGLALKDGVWHVPKTKPSKFGPISCTNCLHRKIGSLVK